MAKSKNNSKRNIVFIVIFILLAILGAIGVIVFNVYNRELDYKNVVSIKIGDELPSIDAYIDNDEQERLDNNKIEWKDIALEENRIYNAGQYVGYITFRDKRIELKLEVIDDAVPTIDGVADITIYVNEEVDLKKNIAVVAKRKWKRANLPLSLPSLRKRLQAIPLSVGIRPSTM